jgi:hypothetical protein
MKINIKQIKSDIQGPILFMDNNSVTRSTDLVWDDLSKIFTIYGKIRIVDGTQAYGKILMSDTNGNASWYTLPKIGVLGEAEDGNYSDGLYTDLTPDTNVGVFADRVNEILKSIAPSGAPDLEDWTQTTLDKSVTGRLTFSTNSPIVGYVSVPGAPTDATFNKSDKRLGITQKIGGQFLSGTLNSHIQQHSGFPFPAYIEKSFGNADMGRLVLYVNDSVVSEIYLNNLSAQDFTNSGTQTGLVVSHAVPSKFSNGDINPYSMNRTGMWLVSKDELRLGYNRIELKHFVDDSTTITLPAHEVVVDGSTELTTYSEQNIYGLNLFGSKFISGVEYNTDGYVKYDVNIHNAYKNTYSSANNAVTFICNSNTYGILGYAQNESLSPSLGDVNRIHRVVGKQINITQSGIRMLNEYLEINTRCDRTVQDVMIGGTSYVYGLLIDNVAASSTTTFENFDDENFRLVNNLNYDTLNDVTSGQWDSFQSIKDGNSGHVNGMQVFGGRLCYPSLDFSRPNIQNSPLSNTNKNYVGLTGERVYIRYFRRTDNFTANFSMTINGVGGNFVSADSVLSGNDIKVELKLPGGTGWMDAYKDFQTNLFNDGDGMRRFNSGSGREFGAIWGLTIGSRNTVISAGYIILKLTFASTFSGYINSIQFNFE